MEEGCCCYDSCSFFHWKSYNPKILQIQKLKFLGTNSDWTKIPIRVCTARYREIWVCQLGISGLGAAKLINTAKQCVSECYQCRLPLQVDLANLYIIIYIYMCIYIYVYVCIYMYVNVYICMCRCVLQVMTANKHECCQCKLPLQVDVADEDGQWKCALDWEGLGFCGGTYILQVLTMKAASDGK